MGDLGRALEQWSNLLGQDAVVAGGSTLTAMGTATFAIDRRVVAAISPADRDQVQGCVRIANDCEVPIYPVSAGKNWGYGSQVPASDNCTVLHLGRLNHIVDFNENLAYATVQPGVTFRQLQEYLKARGSSLGMSFPGGSPDASVLGNLVERGVGSGPYGDRFGHACGLEVVLPTAEVVHTGFARFPNAATASLHRWGVGASLDGLFSQSNLGIVTQATIWLQPRPAYRQVCYVGISDRHHLVWLIDVLRSLRLGGLVRSNVTVLNDYKSWSLLHQYPWDEARGVTPMPPELLQSIRQGSWSSAWSTRIVLGSMSRQVGEAERRILAELLREKADKLVFVDDDRIQVEHWNPPLDPELVVARVLSPINRERLFADAPTERGIYSTYWRKRLPPPATMDPDRDRCGVVWCAPAVPFDGTHVKAAVEVIEEVAMADRFEPSIGLECVTDRCVQVGALIVYDRDVPGEDERARACHDEMLKRLIDLGYLPWRLGLQSMDGLPSAADDYGWLLGAIKRVIDPNNILAPGRYDREAIGVRSPPVSHG